MKAVYIIGTDTDVGKTLICAGLCWALKEKGYNIGYFKPVLSGAKRRGKMLIPQDTEFVVNFAKIKGDIYRLTPFIFEKPASPHIAASDENVDINVNQIKQTFEDLSQNYEFVIIEGCGGLAVPLKEERNQFYMQYQLIKEICNNVILVTTTKLGTINHTLLTVEFAKAYGLCLKGIIVNMYKNEPDEDKVINTITKFTNIPILAKVDFINDFPSDVDENKFKNVFKKCFDDRAIRKIMGVFEC
ncbi:dethiobiotin synthase [Caldicellulosiruptor saccharolyticus DSM 8903]|uniref:ATP-dependent dethiobiotin synthetase BioD n=1 Tax=Caldicellulosiruptor saccharolyticus (strain ATCC 43494 / DSM 8903 / Tp8T 6331) TaxID=351627 RepID=BIOD_CALS8|nr:dethiobiotin synthase [Caldicellulosiruptor saccharolyticus]A4XGB6.1 RecName: Full=ATP-dependent dethiobiotin synthetase BioD; AltName: Full=DTB synthetase; Short=DTBS; AltName: Full=Dethiobiotin synthase [Caldicellulosiruptor saccharolyticus DSM 8903]ABP65951.1 dethiobiotin synthase [Caldicellulosiruptor saccharolyticus DSM 8903]